MKFEGFMRLSELSFTKINPVLDSLEIKISRQSAQERVFFHNSNTRARYIRNNYFRVPTHSTPEIYMNHSDNSIMDHHSKKH